MTTIANGLWHRQEGMRILRANIAFTLFGQPRSEIVDRTLTLTGITSGNIHAWDSWYSFTDPTSWNRMIRELTDINTIKYYTNRRDCDNFATMLHAKIIELFRLNGFANVLGEVWRTSDGAYVGWHMWNAYFSSGRRIFYVEPQTDGITEVLARDVVIGGWRYRGNTIYWF